MIFGHGCDLDGEVLDVPENCEYHTFTACGKGSDLNKTIYADFFNNTFNLFTPEKYDSISDFRPDEYDNSVGFTGEQKMYKRNSGDSYVNNKNSTFLELGSYCGLRKMGDMISDNMFISILPYPTFVHFEYPMCMDRQTRPYTLEFYYLHHFVGSLFPTTFQVCKLLHEHYSQQELSSFIYALKGPQHEQFKALIRNNFSIDYASIMDVFKGKHINFACRPICRGPPPLTKDEIVPRSYFVRLRRTTSAKLPITWNPDL